MTKHDKPHVIVTGGAGFIGSFLCDRFLTEGWRVTAVDNFFTGHRRNVKQHEGNTSFSLLEHDVVKPLDMAADLVMNFACPASPVHYQENPIKTVKTNVLGMMNMLGLAKKHGARVVQASTSEVYGDPKVHPQPETYWGNVNTIGIRSCYDEGKRIAETLCFDYHREHGVKVQLGRIFNTYGPRMALDDGRVVSNFIVQALKGQDITIYGDGDQTRSFCYVEDLVQGFWTLTQRPDLTGPYNLGNEGEFTIAELADVVLSLTQSKSKIVRKPLPADDPKVRRPDLTKTRKELGWEPKIPLKEGIARAIPYFKSMI